MIGLFDTGLGGLTIARALRALPNISFTYFGDQANAPYGERDKAEILALTQHGVEVLFSAGAKLVVLACNTATCVALRDIQQNWLLKSDYKGRNVIGIVAPTVEAATQTPWSVQTPEGPGANLKSRIALFGTVRTIQSGVYEIEIAK